MDQVHVIRHKVLVEKLSQRQVAQQMGVSRNTVKQYLSQPAPKYGPRAPSRRPVWGRVQARLLELLATAHLWTSSKQRLTATRLHRMLADEGHRVGVTLVREAVAEWKRQKREVFVPLAYHPGELGEVDFFEVVVIVAGVRRKAWMFLLRLMHSGRDFAWLYERQDQVSFLDGHIRAFAHLGAVVKRLAYDNLRAAVRGFLVGSERRLTTRFEALASHYLFEPCFCRPRTGHDKGGVESRGKGVRLQDLVPIPSGDSLDDISAQLLARLDTRLGQGADADGHTIGDRFAVEKAAMIELGAHPFDARTTVFPLISRRSLARIEGAYYSAPCEWNGLGVTAHIGPSTVELVGPTGSVVHPRKRFGERSIDYRHYVRELARKPQAVRQVAAELCRDLGEPFPSAWRVLADAHGPKQAARIMAKVLGHVETRGLIEVARVVTGALERGEPLLLALAPAPPVEARLDEDALPSGLRTVVIDAASAADYDLLLQGGAR
ncbi:MAG TPA: IS21 family transposase [Steroidobacteraceae bacterium]|nr:IS21 family transposase [Steroidobacteraceae bacterium]